MATGETKGAQSIAQFGLISTLSNYGSLVQKINAVAPAAGSPAPTHSETA